MDNKTYHIITIGCQMNKADSERIASVFEEAGYKETDDRKFSAFIVLTTCGVRQAAEDRAYGLVEKIRQENKKAKIILAGCLSERKDVIKRLNGKVDMWLPAREICDLRFKIYDLSAKSNEESQNIDNESRDYLKIKPKYTSFFSAFVPIGNGCDNFCTYCVVPYARGREVYRPAEEIIAEAKDLAGRGYKEIVLIAQNVNSYRSEFSISNFQFSNNFQFLNDKILKFSDLLRLVNEIKGDFWIRFATSHPKDMSDDLITAIAECEKVCKHIHLPAQAGDNKVLQGMNRKYTIEHYLGLIKKIRSQISDSQFLNSKLSWHAPVSLSTDIIVGFPGETEEQFGNTMKLFKEVEYDMAYIAQYSPRPGTAAEKLKDNVLPSKKKHREEELTKILRITALKNNQKYLNKTVRILVETQNKKGELLGRTGTNKTVKFSGNKNLLGQFANIKINEAKDFGLSGVLKK